MTFVQYYKKYTKKFLTTSLILFIFLFGRLYSQTPGFNYSLSNKCTPSVVTFTNTSVINPAYTYMWDFGKGGLVFSTNISLEEVYTDPGIYTVTLSIINGTDTNSTSKSFSLAAGPTALIDIDENEGCVPFTINYSDASTAGDGAITDYLWDFRTGEIRTSSSGNYTYETAGEYDVFLSIKDENGCTSYFESKNLVKVYDNPDAEFSASSRFSCFPPLYVDFTNLTESDNNITSAWTFGNGNSSLNIDGSTTYDENGSYSVSLKVTDDNGCIDSIYKEDYIFIGRPEGDIILIQGIDTLPLSDSILCAGNYLVTSTLPQQTDYSWTVIYNGVKQEISTSSIFSIDLLEPGTIDVKLLYGLRGFCPDSILKTFLIDDIDADFELNDYYTCELPVTLDIENLSNSATNYTWEMPDGSVVTDENPSYEIKFLDSYEKEYIHELNEYSYHFRLIARNDRNCADTMVKSFIAVLPIARLMPDTAQGCAPLTVIFSDSSKSKEPISEWKYYIESDEIVMDDESPVTHTFSDAGIYNVFSIITNDSGCVDTSYNVSIKVGEKIEPDFSVSPATLCYGDKLELSNNVTQTGISISYNSAGIFNTAGSPNSSTEIELKPDTAGVFPVDMTIDYNGCISNKTVFDAIQINRPVGGSFYEEFDCDSSLVYKLISGIEGAENLTWSVNGDAFIDVDTVDYKFPSSGDYTVSLTATNSTSGCSITKNKIIQARQVEALMEVKATACLNEELIFSSAKSVDYIDTCQYEGFLWKWDDTITPDRRTYLTSYKHTYIDTGIYQPVLLVTGINGCMASDTATVEVVQPVPVITANPGAGCGPTLSVDLEFANYTSDIINWSWIFGDNYTEMSSTNLLVTHNYNSVIDNTFTPVLLVEDIYGCRNYGITTVNITVPSSQFQANQRGICAGESVLFSFYETEIDSFLIDFGDGYSSKNQKTHTYLNPGNYDVSLTVWTDSCSTTTSRDDFIIVDDLSADYTISSSTSSCYPVTIEFTHTGNSSSVSQGLWTFGENIVKANYNPTVQFTYSEPGTYTSSLWLKSIYGCEVKVEKEIEVGGPEAFFTFSPQLICSGDTVYFQLDSIKNADEYEWYFGDGQTSTEENPSHIYTAKGIITPSVWMKQGNCEVTQSDENLFVSLVNADFALNNDDQQYCLDARLNTTNLSSYYTSQQWVLNTSLISNDNEISNYPLLTMGEHPLTLIVSDNYGCSDTALKIVNVHPFPEYSIEGDTLVCSNQDISLSIPEFQEGWSITWHPNQIISNPTSPNTIVSPDSTTTISASITNQYGCTKLEQLTIQVEKLIQITRIPLGDTSIYLGENLQILIEADKENVVFLWEPDDNISCTDCPNPIVSPTKNITYILTATDNCGDQTEAFVIEVNADYYLELPNAFSPNGDEENDVFRCDYKNIYEADFRIFNRWGNLVFSTTNLDEGWDGKVNGVVQNIDTYTYYVRAKTIHGFELEKKGTFLLLK
ncbi:MAG: PKD domain-containing protein [Bacteroidales bacterium]|nr:PKD domain-containing protein [Bacteroidales bacterium]MBN2820097.1 PKD domain-containing protein [Bacteroidales bacterium]